MICSRFFIPGDFLIVRPPSRFPRQESFNRGPAINDRIRAKQVFLIDANNEKVGVVELIEALRRSHDAGLDLVEIASDVVPPVCRILDFGKWKYEQAKKDKANKAKSKTVEMKEVRLGRSMKIDPHDVGIRVNQAREFLLEGHKVLMVQNFRGREMMHRHLGDTRMKDIIEKLSDVSKVETSPRLNGRKMTLILAPDKSKIDAILRKRAKDTKQGQGTKAAESKSPSSSALAPADAHAPETPENDHQAANEPVEVHAEA